MDPILNDSANIGFSKLEIEKLPHAFPLQVFLITIGYDSDNVLICLANWQTSLFVCLFI